MKKSTLFAVSLLLVGTLSGLTLGAIDSKADPVSTDYSDIAYTFDGYTVIQGDPAIDGNNATVPFTVTGNDYTGSYEITMEFSDSGFVFNPTSIAGNGTTVIIVPPTIRINGNNCHLSSVVAPTANIAVQVQKLYILTEGREIQMPANCFRYVPSLTDLTITGNVTVNQNLVRGQTNLKSVYIDSLVNPASVANNITKGYYSTTSITNENEVTFSLKIANTTTVVSKLFDGNPLRGGVILKLLPGSAKPSSINLTGVTEVQVSASDYPEDVTVNDLATSVTGNSDSLKITRYGVMAPTSYNVSVADEQTGVAVDKESAAEDEVVTVTLTPPQGKQVASVSVIGADNTPVQATVDQQNSNVYTFTMPASDVTVSATFENEPSVLITTADSNVAKGSSTNVTVSADNLKNVSSLYITLTYDTTMFELKSPAYSNLLDSAMLKGDVTNGEYVVAFSEPQNLTGDLFTFQLEAKDDATVGTYAISCVVEINGTVNNGVNQPEASYNNSSELTIGNMLGDLDSDGDVDEDDAVYLLLYTFRASTHLLPEGQNVDYNNDGVVNSDDAIYLKNYLTDHAQYPLSGGA